MTTSGLYCQYMVEITFKCVSCKHEMTVKGVAPPEVCPACFSPMYAVKAEGQPDPEEGREP